MIRSDFSPLVVEKISKHSWRLVEDWKTPFFTIGAGFVSDGASIPRILWMFSHPAAEFFEASVFHDYCYKLAIENKAFADDNFCKIALTFGADAWKVKLAGLAVRRIGRGQYK